MSTQNVNVTRFARNVECDFFCDFQTPWTGCNCSSFMDQFMSNPGLNHIGVQILSHVDPISMDNCRLVNHSWKNLIDTEFNRTMMNRKNKKLLCWQVLWILDSEKLQFSRSKSIVHHTLKSYNFRAKNLSSPKSQKSKNFRPKIYHLQQFSKSNSFSLKI